MGKVAAERVDHGSDMEVGVGVDTAGHLELLNREQMVCDDGHVVLSLLLNGWAARASRRLDKTVMGACSRRLL